MDRGRHAGAQDRRSRVLWSAWRYMAPTMPPAVYLHRRRLYSSHLQSIEPSCHGKRDIGPDEAARIPDNSESFERYTYSYHGLESVQARVAEGSPVAFVSWHHGAQSHRDYGIARVLPTTEFFSTHVFQYGRIFSHASVRDGRLTLVKMRSFLRAGRPVHCYLDGPAIGTSVHIPMFGRRCSFSVGPVHLFRSIQGLNVIPVTSYYGSGRSVNVTFHPPFPLHPGSDGETLEALIGFFERDLKENAPEQILLRFLRGREQLVQQQKRP